jgi:hypothetical protein
MTTDKGWRCVHRHTALSHPKCYAKYLLGDKNIKQNPRTAKILLLDIETSFMVAEVWNRDAGYLRPEQIVKNWSILGWSAKWLFEPEIMGEVVTPKEAIARTEESIMDGVYKLLCEADIVIWHNGRKFDKPRLNTKLLKHGYKPPTPYKDIDTYRVVKDNFQFTSNSLDELGKELLGLDGKLDMHYADWKRCCSGDKPALDKMLAYCKNDVAPLLEDLYLFLLPWISNHPNLNIYTDDGAVDCCRNCESTDVKWNNHYYPTPQGMWYGWRCNACGAIGRSTDNIKKTKIK